MMQLCLCVASSLSVSRSATVRPTRGYNRVRYSLNRQLLLERMMRRWVSSGSSGRPSAEM